MKKCDCYREKDEIIGWIDPETPITTLVSRCYGTKECDICVCGGDRTKCDFYPEVREQRQPEECPICKDNISCDTCYYGQVDGHWKCDYCDNHHFWEKITAKYCRNCGRKLI